MGFRFYPTGLGARNMSHRTADVLYKPLSDIFTSTKIERQTFDSEETEGTIHEGGAEIHLMCLL